VTIAEITQALSRHARAAADLARWCTAHARAEDNQRDAEEQARRAGVHADKARCLFEAIRALDPDGLDAKVALLAASEASKSYLESRIICAVKASRAKVVRVA
jgi:hypothetical protein